MSLRDQIASGLARLTAAIVALNTKVDGTPVTERLTEIVGTDDLLAFRVVGGVLTPYRVSASVLASYMGWSPAATEPGAFTDLMWDADPTASPGELSFSIGSLPPDGGSDLTALEYRVGTGDPIAFAGTGTGVRVVTAGLTAGAAADLQVRAVNAVGVGAWSNTKTRTPAAEDSAPALNGASRAGPSSFGSTLTFTPPAGMQAGDQLVLVVYGSSTYTSANVGTFTDVTPASWLAAPSVRRLLVSAPFVSVPGSVSLTFGSNAIHQASAYAVGGGVSTAAVLGSGTGTTGTSAGARNHAYTVGSANSLEVGFVDFIGGGLTGVGSADAEHTWDLRVGGGYASAFGAVRSAAGSYNASVAPVGASSASQYGWVEIGSD